MDRMEFTMPLGEAMETQRAVRRLKPDPVDDGLVLRLIELALRAPTGSNAQNREFIVARDPKIKEGPARLNRILWRPYGRIGWWVTRRNPKRRKILNAVQWQGEDLGRRAGDVVSLLEGGGEL